MDKLNQFQNDINKLPPTNSNEMKNILVMQQVILHPAVLKCWLEIKRVFRFKHEATFLNQMPFYQKLKKGNWLKI